MTKLKTIFAFFVFFACQNSLACDQWVDIDNNGKLVLVLSGDPLTCTIDIDEKVIIDNVCANVLEQYKLFKKQSKTYEYRLVNACKKRSRSISKVAEK
jgi:hypothetical protein